MSAGEFRPGGPVPPPVQLSMFCLPCAMEDTCAEHDPAPEPEDGFHQAVTHAITTAILTGDPDGRYAALRVEPCQVLSPHEAHDRCPGASA